MMEVWQAEKGIEGNGRDLIETSCPNLFQEIEQNYKNPQAG
jgi:hypothetical protein